MVFDNAALRLRDTGNGFFQIGMDTGFEQAQMEFRRAGPDIVTGVSFKMRRPCRMPVRTKPFMSEMW